MPDCSALRKGDIPGPRLVLAEGLCLRVAYEDKALVDESVFGQVPSTNDWHAGINIVACGEIRAKGAPDARVRNVCP